MMKNINFINPSGQIGKAIHFIEQEQLLDTKLWKDCVNVFRGNCDDADHGWRGEYWGKCFEEQHLFIRQITILNYMIR